MYTDNQKAALLQTARHALETFVRTHEHPAMSSPDPALQEKRGAFVTLYKDATLRGCIGYIAADMPLWDVIRDMAIKAATADPRFAPLQADELADVSLEISVLSPFEEIISVDEIEVGKDGLLIRQGLYSGLLLPQVAAEYGWTREEFLEHTCYKAGLPADAWKTGVRIFRFRADVFGERT